MLTKLTSGERKKNLNILYATTVDFIVVLAVFPIPLVESATAVQQSVIIPYLSAVSGDGNTNCWVVSE